MKTFTTKQVLAALGRKITACESQTRAADSLGFTPQFISDVITGRRSLTPKLALALGFVKLEDRYVAKKEKTA